MKLKKNTNFQKYLYEVHFHDTSREDYQKVDNLYYKTWTPAKTSTKPKTLQEMSREALVERLVS